MPRAPRPVTFLRAYCHHLLGAASLSPDRAGPWLTRGTPVPQGSPAAGPAHSLEPRAPQGPREPPPLPRRPSLRRLCFGFPREQSRPRGGRQQPPLERRRPRTVWGKQEGGFLGAWAEA